MKSGLMLHHIYNRYSLPIVDECNIFVIFFKEVKNVTPFFKITQLLLNLSFTWRKMSGILDLTSSAFWLTIVLCDTNTHKPIPSYLMRELPSEDLSKKTATII